MTGQTIHENDQIIDAFSVMLYTCVQVLLMIYLKKSQFDQNIFMEYQEVTRFTPNADTVLFINLSPSFSR